MKFGLIGEKLGHSFSKEIHALLGDYEYELCEIPRDELDRFMREGDFIGINVTIPYKEAVIPYLSWISEAAKKIGAVNTVINHEGKLYGYNTDYFGMMDLFNHAGIEAKGKKALIIGTGGTSKTAYAVLKALGAREILKVSRSGKDGAITYDQLYEDHIDAEIIVNTTPVGMYPDIYSCPVDISKFRNLEGVIDPIYNPINTTLIMEAKKRGIKAEGGLYMLVSQAAVASELFLDQNGNTAPYWLAKFYSEIKAKKENIVLIGMPSSGKSTVGEIIAKELGREFIDTDKLVESKIGMSIKSYFEKHGEEEFRDVESQVLREIANRSSLVISTGGGVVLRSENISALKYNGKLYFIDRPLSDLTPTDDRPLSQDGRALEALYNKRYPIYLGYCDESIDASCPAQDVAKKIMENYR